MLETQLLITRTGIFTAPMFFFPGEHPSEDLSLSIVLELNDGSQPSAPEGTTDDLDSL